MDRSSSRKFVPLAGTLVVGMVLAACAGGGEAGAEKSGNARGAWRLGGVCPQRIVVQSASNPEAEQGALYRLVGPGYRIDEKGKRVTGRLVASGGRDTGVEIEIRAGGPAAGHAAGAQLTIPLMYRHPEITLGQIATDDAITHYSKNPTIAVVAPFDIAPNMIMWDPETHPGFNIIVDIGQSRAEVLSVRDTRYMEYLVEAGILRREQVDERYSGSPAEFASSPAKVAQGRATSDPYFHEQRKKPVRFQLVHDTGYQIYSGALAVRSSQKAELAPCLRRLVPIIQRAQVEYIKRPEATNRLIVELVDRYRVGYPYTLRQAAFSVRQQLELSVVGNGPNRTLGDFETDRVQRVIENLGPIFAAQNRPVKQGFRAENIVTNDFIDPTISLTR